MATECTQEAILDFLTERGGRVKNTDLTDRFKAVFPDEPERKAVIRERFKSYVDNVAFVKVDGGVKFVCLKKRYRGSVKRAEKENGTSRPGTEPGRVSDGETELRICAASGERQQEILPGSGYGNDNRETVPHVFSSATILPDKTAEKRNGPEFVCVVEKAANSSSEMGNLVSFKGGKSESEEGCVPAPPEIPVIAVIEASPLPAAAEGSMFIMPGYQSGPIQTGTSGQVDASIWLNPADSVNREIESESVSQDSLNGADQTGVPVVTRRRNSIGSQRKLLYGNLADDGQSDSQSLSGSEGNSSPKVSRKHFIEAMMNSSPQVRRSMVLRNSVHLSSRYQDGTRSDSDTASLVSSNPEEDGASVTLDPLEHEWMICASDGQWDSLYQLLAEEPSLVLKKDFVTGFTCLHWAAKQGKPELLALIINFAKQHAVPVNINARSSAGYTPLHLAAMHSHMEVVKLLVGAYDADVEIRDYSGKKACQYLTNSVTADIRDIIGAYEFSRSEKPSGRGEGRWRFSKVLQSNLKLLGHNEGDSVDGGDRARRVPLRSKSSLSGMKPKLQKLRHRTSQVVRSTSFRETETLEGSLKALFKSRPKSNVIG